MMNQCIWWASAAGENGFATSNGDTFITLCWKLVQKTEILAWLVLQQRKTKTKVLQLEKINLLQANES